MKNHNMHSTENFVEQLSSRSKGLPALEIKGSSEMQKTMAMNLYNLRNSPTLEKPKNQSVSVLETYGGDTDESITKELSVQSTLWKREIQPSPTLE